MKKVAVIIVCLLIVFIPTYIAIGSYFSSQTAPVRENTVDKLEISTPSGNKFELLKQSDDDGFIEAMIAANTSAEKVLALPDPLRDNPYYALTYYSYNRATTYHYYFSRQSTDAYMVDPNGLAYHLTKTDAERFLKTEYAYELFDNYKMPNMLFDSKEMLPSKADWLFRGYDNEFYHGITKTAEPISIETYGTPSISFDIEPDLVNLTLKNGNEIVFSGLYNELVNQDFGGQVLDATVEANYFEVADRSYCGDLTYEFKIEFKKPPMFFISSNKATIGDIVTISVLYAEDANSVNLKCEPALGFTPVFVKDGDYMRALIPISTSYIPGTYKISADYVGHSATEFDIEISGRYTANYPYNIEDSVFNSLYNDTNISAYDKLFNSFFDVGYTSKKFDGSFISGLPKGTFESADYGDLLTINHNDAAFENPGLYYSCNVVSDIKAVNSGVVIYAGNDNLMGNVVAVDHGLGLISVYKHLGSVDVTAGDIVEKTTILGKSGRTGLMSKKGAAVTVARVELYVNKVPVDVTPLIEHGVLLTK